MPECKMSRADAAGIGRLDALGQADLVNTGQVSPSELVEAALIRMDILNPELNLLTYRDDDMARHVAQTAAGQMRGVPWLVKETLDYPGMPSRHSSRSREGASVASGSDYTRAFDAQGLVPMGKSNAPEFSLTATTEPLLHGPSRNPWSLERSTGGSSGGAAASVAAGMVPLAHAADGGGSIRIPASCCGVVGLKPGRGGNLRARAPHLIDDLLACDVLLSRSVRDVAWAAAIGAGRPQRVFGPDARRLKIAIVRDNLYGAAPAPAVGEVLEHAAKLCSDLGHEVVDLQLPVDGPAAMQAFLVLWSYDGREVVALTEARIGADKAREMLEPWTRGLASSSDKLTAQDVDTTFRQIGKIASAMDELFERYDVVLSPVLRHPTFRIGEIGPMVDFEIIWQKLWDYVSYTPLYNLSGHPSISLPLFADSDGMPVGSMFSAGRGKEELLISLSFELEQAAPWADRWPTHSIGGVTLIQ
jgi:amidase